MKWRPTLFKDCGALYDTFWLPEDADNDQIARAIKQGRLHDAEIVETILSYILPATTVIDVGACYGQMSLLFAERVVPRGRVIAVEASPYNALLCRLNFHEHRMYANIEVHERAAWDKSGIVVAYPEQDSGRYGSTGVLPHAPDKVSQLPITTIALDDLNRGDRVSAVKIDTEGADLIVLHGLEKTLRVWRPAVVFEFDRGGNRLGLLWAEVIAFLDSVGYKIERAVQDQANWLALPVEGIAR